MIIDLIDLFLLFTDGGIVADHENEQWRPTPPDDQSSMTWTQEHEGDQRKPAPPDDQSSQACTQEYEGEQRRPTPPDDQSSQTWTQGYAEGQWRPTPPNEDGPQSSSFAKAQDGGPTQETERTDPGAMHMRQPALPGHRSHASAEMFTNAIVTIYGGTFENVAHIYGHGSPALIAVLGVFCFCFLSLVIL